MTDHQPLPVSGYKGQSDASVQLVNEGKRLEELYLRWLDKLAADPATDKRHVALAKTNVEQGAMWAVRSIFQPKRINLPDDVAVVHP